MYLCSKCIFLSTPCQISQENWCFISAQNKESVSLTFRICETYHSWFKDFYSYVLKLHHLSIHLFTVFVHMCIYVHALGQFGGQRTICKTWFFLSIMWSLEMELRLLGLVADGFTNWVTSPPWPLRNIKEWFVELSPGSEGGLISAQDHLPYKHQILDLVPSTGCVTVLWMREVVGMWGSKSWFRGNSSENHPVVGGESRSEGRQRRIGF